MKRTSRICECGDHAFVPITRGLNTLVSPQDKPILDLGSWHANLTATGYVAVRGTVKQPNGQRRSAVLARTIMLPATGFLVDHKNCDPLDNRRHNLRVCTPLENVRNRRVNRGTKTGVKGVVPKGPSFVAAIFANGKRIHLGSFPSIEEARSAYSAAAEKLFGEFARVA